jgi:hypothetical protein
MNAIELADELINWYPKVNLCVASAIMLRQQEKEIEQLKVDVEHYADRWRDACGNLQIEKEIEQLKATIQAFRAGRGSKSSFAFGFEAPVIDEQYKKESEK